MLKKILYQGAEAILTLENNLVHKKRIKKSYRIPEIDIPLRKQRTRKEAKILDKLKGKIPVPKLIKLNEANSEIILEYIKGKKLSDCLDKLKNKNKVMHEIAKSVSLVHNQNIIHGDLTTSNMILVKDKVYLIDFGLSFHSSRIEDKAVDLHLLKQALEAKHYKHYRRLFSLFLKYYNPENKARILEQLKRVEARGRYK